MPEAKPDPMPAPLFVVAPMGRSGTNYLKNMLATHPDLYLADVLEDYLTAHAGKLDEYVTAVFTHWSRLDVGNYTGPGEVGPDDMLAAIGKALLSFVGGDKDPVRRPLLKTPGIGDLDVGLRLFPGSNYLVIIRDPRSIAESHLHVKSEWKLPVSFEQLAANWARRIRDLTRILAENQDAVRQGRIVTIRYEMLVSEPAATLNAALERVGMRPFPEEDAPDSDFPVIGSSFGRRNAAGRIDFTPQPKPDGFDPLRRWESWTPEQHRRFNRICGALMQKWGYEPVD